MRIGDITTKEHLDEAFESAMAMATGSMGDRAIISMMRDVADQVESVMRVEYDLPMLDSARIDSPDSAKLYVVAAAVRGFSIIPPARVIRMLDRKSDEYEREIA